MKKEFAKLDLMDVLQRDAEEMVAARSNAIIIHGTKDIDAAGDEVEIEVRKILARKLASRYYVGHGHILDQNLTTSPQLDVIIADNSGAPVLYQTKSGSEYFPFESVYAFGEIKSAYYKSKKYVEHHSENLAKIRSELKREQTPPNYISSGINFGEGFNFQSERPYRNPLFSFMLFVDSNDFDIENIIPIYETKPPTELPNVLCILNKGVAVNMRYKKYQEGEPVINLNVIPEFGKSGTDEASQWFFVSFEGVEKGLGKCFSYFLHVVSWHLKNCTLMQPDLFKYMKNVFGEMQNATVLTPSA